MTTLDAYTRTRRTLLGSGSDLVEHVDANGDIYTGIVFHPQYRGHPALGAALAVVLPFLEAPMVSGMPDLAAWDVGAGTFLYKTGPAWSVAEVVRTLADTAHAGGIRSGVQLLAAAGACLVEAAEAGESRGIYSHGGVTPWRILLDRKGKVHIVGYALPQVEILSIREDPNHLPREDAFRYCPPERLDGRRENFSSDLFSVALVAVELMVGQPVYDGLAAEIRAAAAAGDAARNLGALRAHLPESVRELLTTALQPSFRDRFSSGAGFEELSREALADRSLVGPSLADLMSRQGEFRGILRASLDPSQTAMHSVASLGVTPKGTPPRRAGATPPRAASPPARAPEPAVPALPPPPRAGTPLRTARTADVSAAPADAPAPATPAATAKPHTTAAPPAKPSTAAAPITPAPTAKPPPAAPPAKAAPAPTPPAKATPAPRPPAPPAETAPPPTTAPEPDPPRPPRAAPTPLVESVTGRTAPRPPPPEATPAAPRWRPPVRAGGAAPEPTPDPAPSAPPVVAALEPPPRPRFRTPDATGPGPKGELLPILLSRGPGSVTHRRRLPGDATLAEVVGLLVGSFVPLRTTADGRLTGWYRLGPPSGPLPPTALVSTVPPDQVLQFHFIPNTTVAVDLTWNTTTLRLPTSATTPVQSLVDCFASLFDLPAGDWGLVADGARLSPAAILADLPPRPSPLALQLIG